VILAREPDSYLYAGLRRGVDRDLLARETARHCVELCAHRVEPKVGDCFFLPAGVLHALGPGLLVAEIQQPSDVTYRLWDWNRRGPDGQVRALHVEQALAAIDFDYGPVAAQQPQPTEQQHVERLVACDKFVIDRLSFSDLQTIGGDGRCHIAVVTEGEISVGGDPSEQPLPRGHVVLLPAELGPVPVRASGPSVVLDTYLP
jgi:mannose-6-phosphate isomerase